MFNAKVRHFFLKTKKNHKIFKKKLVSEVFLSQKNSKNMIFGNLFAK